MKESDIRPKDLFNRYLDLVRRDNEALFADRAGFIDVDCPACGTEAVGRRFEKDGFEYRECADCRSLYQSPRPDTATLARFYQEAESVKFWGTEFYRQTAEARREKLFKPRARDIAELADRHLTAGLTRFCDIGAGYGTLLEEVITTNHFTTVSGVEPAPTLAALCRDKGFEIIEATIEDLPQTAPRADFLTAFEVIEHVASPFDFLTGVKQLLSQNGIALLTTLTADGFDIQTLWDHSKAVHPPHHINLLSVEGYRSLIERAGLACVEITTPGKLDVDIVRNTLKENPDIDVPPFIRRLVSESDENIRAAFQAFLADHRLSSHIRILITTK
ncbi:MAG: class I SAM-dependent methyltransferase [Rhodospirillales bacterium]